MMVQLKGNSGHVAGEAFNHSDQHLAQEGQQDAQASDTVAEVVQAQAAVLPATGESRIAYLYILVALILFVVASFLVISYYES